MIGNFISGLPPLLGIFLIGTLGYLFGSISIRHISLGSAAVMIVALVFGHFGFTVDSLVRDMGLAMFVCSVGFIAGPTFFNNLKHYAGSYLILGILIIGTSTLCAVAIVKLSGMSTELIVGLMTGALTSTPGLAAAQEAAGAQAALATAGYAIAYPFGVIGVVLFVQLLPRLLKLDMEEERHKLEKLHVAERHEVDVEMLDESAGFLGFCAAVVIGIVIGQIRIPLSGSASFALGVSGGPLFTGLILGYIATKAKLKLTIPVKTLNTFRELGLMLFLIGAGVSGGADFVSTLQQEGIELLLYGVILTMLPMIIAYPIAAKRLKLSAFNNLGAITGGMTSTPALGALIASSGTDDVANAYAATYPIALVCVVLASQIMVLFI